MLLLVSFAFGFVYDLEVSVVGLGRNYYKACNGLCSLPGLYFSLCNWYVCIMLGKYLIVTYLCCVGLLEV